MKWFGHSWGAPICVAEDRASTPVGECCPQCDVAIKDGDDGLLVPNEDNKGGVPYHVVCFLRAVGVGNLNVTALPGFQPTADQIAAKANMIKVLKQWLATHGERDLVNAERVRKQLASLESLPPHEPSA